MWGRWSMRWRRAIEAGAAGRFSEASSKKDARDQQFRALPLSKA